MANQSEGTLGVEEAYEALHVYGRTYGELPLRLLLHVAVPQRFRPDFINLAKINFLPAEAAGDLSTDADVLFAPFVETTGAGYYQLDGEVRRQCLLLLDATYAHRREFRSARVADLLLAYLEHLEQHEAAGLDPLLEEYVAIERWVASAFLAPAQTATRLAEALKRATEKALVGQGLLARFGPVASAITIPLAGQQDLLEYARGFDALVSGNLEHGRTIMTLLGDRELEIGGILLTAPTHVLSAFGFETVHAGRALTLRPIRPEDEAALRAFLRRLSPEDQRLRFFIPLTKSKRHQFAARLTQIDYNREMTFVLIDPHAEKPAILGMINTVADPEGARAEFAVLVRSDLKNQGLGRLLLEESVEWCRRSGIREIWGSVLMENVPMLSLVRKLGFAITKDPDEEIMIVRKTLSPV
jgi:GNAT superfamily N-acetyltransferase